MISTARPSATVDDRVGLPGIGNIPSLPPLQLGLTDTASTMGGSGGRFGWGAFRPIVKRDFGLLWLGETISQVGDSLNRVALLWFVYQTSHSTLRMSLVGVLQTLPPLIFGPLIGAYLDKVRKRPVLIAVSLARALLVSTIPLLYGAHLLGVGLLYLIVFVLSVIGTAAGPALLTSVPLLVAPADLAAANALFQGTATLGVLVGPTVAGLGISLFGISKVLYLDAASFLAFALCVGLARIPEAAAGPRVPWRFRELAGDLRTGLAFLLQRQTGILSLTMVASVQNLGASAFIIMLPAFVHEDFLASSLWLGTLWSALGVGMLLASLSIALLGAHRLVRLLRIALLALVLGGISIAALRFVKVKLAAASLMVVIGWSSAAFNPVIISIVQRSTPVGLRARILTTFNSANMAAVAAGMLIFGWAAEHVSSGLAMIGIGGILLISAVALGMVMRVQTTRQLVEKLARQA
jgi:DHA3 family macrolide efflux protein-like MFS transporter